MLRPSNSGRPPLPESTIKEIKRLTSAGYSLRSIAAHLHISAQTVFKYKHQKD
ncbi:helix-turn-helix domain-containing protein [Vibrio parahaemolyticus]|nr:helix-turn-helix domain-containing protein [Vibrio parahaemolyticus]